MELTVYSSFDFVSETFSQPWLAPNDKAAIRAFAFAVNDPALYLNKSPQDYALFKVANFDDHTGSLQPINPAIVVKAIDLLQPEQGAAVGGATPLKQQSVSTGEDENDAEIN